MSFNSHGALPVNERVGNFPIDSHRFKLKRFKEAVIVIEPFGCFCEARFWPGYGADFSLAGISDFLRCSGNNDLIEIIA